MTLIAGFKCTLLGGEKGVVICADTQETRGDFRVPVKKIAIQDRGNYQLVVGGAGELGGLIDDFAEGLGLAVKGWPAGLSEQSIRLKIKKLLMDFHNNEVKSYPTPEWQKLLEFLICLKDKNAADIYLWRTEGSGLKTVQDFALVGIGEDFYKSQVERLYRPDISMPQAFLLGTYVLSQATETVHSIGGKNIQLAGATSQGMFDCTPDEVRQLEERVSLFDEALTQLVLACPDVSLSPREFEKLLKSFEDRIMELRNHYIYNAIVRAKDGTARGGTPFEEAPNVNYAILHDQQELVPSSDPKTTPKVYEMPKSGQLIISKKDGRQIKELEQETE